MQAERIPVPSASAPARSVSAPAPSPQPHGWIAEASHLRPGQIEKSKFLALLREEVCRAAEAALSGTGRSSKDCPYLDYWFSYYASRDAVQVERALLRYAPDANRATSAAQYIPIAVQRVGKGIANWVGTGEIDAPPEALAQAPAPEDAQAVRRQLGTGSPLPGHVRTRMETAFGHDFSRVRIHADDNASRLSANLDARAFTVGNDIAFASGALNSAGPMSDILLAHELAHVVQQEGAQSPAPPEQYGALEQDAGRAALAVTASLRAGARAKLGDIARNAGPRLRSGLSLQRCSNKDKPTSDPAVGSAAGRCAADPNPLKPGLIEAKKVNFDCDAMIKDRPLDEVEKLGERGHTPAGVTLLESRELRYSIEGLGGTNYKMVWTARPKFELDPYVYARVGTFATGKLDISDPPCAGRTVTVKKSVDRALSDKVKAGEKEHCEDAKIAYGRTFARYEQLIDVERRRFVRGRLLGDGHPLQTQ